VFVNRDGNPWTAYSMSCRFARLKKSLGVKFCGTAFRHGFATRKLVEGHDHLSVAELLGHSNGRMLAETYQHLADHDTHLRKVLNNA
jgi:integrase